MAERERPTSTKGPEPATEIVGAPRRAFEPLVTALGGGTLDFSAMLAIADILPVMVAYVDRSLTYRFVNKPLADWLGRPRKDVLGKTVREIIGEEAFAPRAPLFAMRVLSVRPPRCALDARRSRPLAAPVSDTRFVLGPHSAAFTSLVGFTVAVTVRRAGIQTR